MLAFFLTFAFTPNVIATSSETSCQEVLNWCYNPLNFLTKNCDSTAPNFDPATCQNLYLMIGQNDCIVRAFRSGSSSEDPCANVKLPYGVYDDKTLDTLESMVACENFSYAHIQCVDEFSKLNPDWTDINNAQQCIDAAARRSEFKDDDDAQECLQLTDNKDELLKSAAEFTTLVQHGHPSAGSSTLAGDEPTARPTLSGMTHAPEEPTARPTLAGMTHTPKEPTARPTLSGMTHAPEDPTARPTLSGMTDDHTALCGCICPGDICLALYRCTQTERAKQLAECSLAKSTFGEGDKIPSQAPWGPLFPRATSVPRLAGNNDVGNHPVDCPCDPWCGLLTAPCHARRTRGALGSSEDHTDKKTVEEVPTARPTHNADGFKGAVCGAICPGDDRMGVYLCTQGERLRQLAQCPTTMTKYCAGLGKIWQKEGGCRDCTEKDGAATRKDGVTPKYPQCLQNSEDDKIPFIPMLAEVPRPTHNADGFQGAVCGAICPGVGNLGIQYPCTQLQRQRQLAQCPTGSPDEVPTARPTHNADGFKGAVCGAICPGDDRMGVYLCTQGERQRQLAQCSSNLKNGEDDEIPFIPMLAEKSCTDVLQYCEDKLNFIMKNCDSTAPNFDPATCQNLYLRIGQADCVVRAFRSGSTSEDPCANVKLPYGEYDDKRLDTLESIVACENFSYAHIQCVDEFSKRNPGVAGLDRAFKCIFDAAKQPEFKDDKDAQECLKFENYFVSEDASTSGSD